MRIYCLAYPVSCCTHRHSWFRHKILSYSVTLHVPSLLATETAKCSRAANALRTCARDRDRANLRGQQAAEEEKEANDTVEVRPLALAADAGWERDTG